MPYIATSKSKRHNGWFYDQVNGRLAAVFNGTEVFDFDANDLAIAQATAITGGATVLTGNLTITAGDQRNTAGNNRLGAVSAFGTTEPVSATVWKAGTAPAGSVATSGGIFTDGTTVKKIIAAGTVSDVQT